MTPPRRPPAHGAGPAGRGSAAVCRSSRVSPPACGVRTATPNFFFDEVTALAAGHRPCMECRRADALAWRAAMVQDLGLPSAMRFPEIDRRLHEERLSGRAKRVHAME